MKYLEVGTSGVKASNIVMGCMRLKGKTPGEAEKIIRTYMEEGVNYFDHADVYGRAEMRGECESVFGQAMDLRNASVREKMIIQGKCGIVKTDSGSYYDFSRDYILRAVDAILGRLNTEYLDFLLLHRPDSLMEPEEVAEAFDKLYKSGKVRHFGVSNFRSLQVELLQKYTDYKLEANQLHVSIPHCPMIDNGIACNLAEEQAFDRDGQILEYSRLKKMTIQAWSPFQYGSFASSSKTWIFLGDRERYGLLNDTLDRIAAEYGVTSTAIAVAWLTTHPANMQVILGSTNPDRIKESCKGSELKLTKAQWYEIYKSAGKLIP